MPYDDTNVWLMVVREGFSKRNRKKLQPDECKVRYLTPTKTRSFVGGWSVAVNTKQVALEATHTFGQICCKVNWHDNKTRVMGRSAWEEIVRLVKDCYAL